MLGNGETKHDAKRHLGCFFAKTILDLFDKSNLLVGHPFITERDLKLAAGLDQKSRWKLGSILIGSMAYFTYL